MLHEWGINRGESLVLCLITNFMLGDTLLSRNQTDPRPRTAMLQGAENKLFSKIVFKESFFCKIFFQLKSFRACFFELLLLKIFWNNYFDQRPESRAHLDFYFHNIKLNIFQHLLSANYQFFTQQMISWFEKSIF